MDDKLSSGYSVKTVLHKNIVKVIKHLGGGGQGDVYEVDYNGKHMAMKWYKHSFLKTGDKNKFYDNLKHNVIKGAPSDAFLWPQDITEWSNETFGYIMEIRPSGYYEVTDYMLTNVRFSSFKTIIDASLKIVLAYRQLHNTGYSYQDLNDGNFFINPDNGKVLICDNDNVAPDGVHTGILGKPRYMAPEIVLGNKMPDSLSDRFSMSVILFILFCMTHPLEGKRSLSAGMPPELQKRLYGSEPLFIMDPNDDANGPDAKIHTNLRKVWPYLPVYMKTIFIKAFSQDALNKPAVRPSEADWVNVLTRFRSEIIECSCGNEIFTNEGRPCNCDKCRKPAKVPFRFELGQYAIPAVPGSRIYRCQVGICNVEDALNPIGAVIANKANPSIHGIMNLCEKSWDAITPSGKCKKVMPKEIIPLKDGIIFHSYNEKISIKSN